MSTNKKISIKDIANLAGVSPSLVSFVLNGKQKQYRVSDQVAEKIKILAKELHYKPNGFAKSLREGTSHTIGVIVSDISNRFFSDIVRNIEIAAEEKGYMAIFSSSDENAETLSDLTYNMLSKGVDGIIVVPCEGSDKTIEMLVEKKIPVVLLDRCIPSIRTDYVCLNNLQASYIATKHLLENGFKNIALVTYDLNLTNVSGRINGYKQAMTESGNKDNINTKFVSIKNLAKSTQKAMSSLSESGTDAVIFATNSIAIQGLYYIQKNDIRIPDDMGLVCFDGGTEFDFFYAPLTYISQPREMLARKSVEILIEKIESGNTMVQQVEAEGILIKQASSVKTK